MTLIEEIPRTPSFGTADAKIEESVAVSAEEINKEIENNASLEKQQAALKEFEKLRQYGFVIQKDIDSQIETKMSDLIKNLQQAMEANLKENMAKLHQENMQLREYFRPAGKSSGAVDSPKEEESELKAWERPFVRR